MARISHRCVTCAAPDWHHEGPGCRLDRDPVPEVIETWTPVWEGRREILTVTPPGVIWPSVGRGVKTCSCAACHDLYLMEGGDALACRCRPCAITAQERADAATAEDVGFDVPTDMGPPVEDVVTIVAAAFNVPPSFLAAP